MLSLSKYLWKFAMIVVYDMNFTLGEAPGSFGVKTMAGPIQKVVVVR